MRVHYQYRPLVVTVADHLIIQPAELEEREAELAKRFLPADDSIDASTVDSLRKQIASHDARVNSALNKVEDFLAQGDEGEPFEWRMRIVLDEDDEEGTATAAAAAATDGDTAMDDPQTRVFKPVDWAKFMRDGTRPV
jgi:hypothetical protein